MAVYVKNYLTKITEKYLSIFGLISKIIPIYYLTTIDHYYLFRKIKQ